MSRSAKCLFKGFNMMMDLFNVKFQSAWSFIFLQAHAIAQM